MLVEHVLLGFKQLFAWVKVSLRCVVGCSPSTTAALVAFSRTDLVNRNKMLESTGLKFKAAMKTGTTISGIVYKVRRALSLLFFPLLHLQNSAALSYCGRNQPRHTSDFDIEPLSLFSLPVLSRHRTV